MISTDQLKTMLTVDCQYRLLAFVDLASVLVTPTALHKMLKTVYNQHYGPDERIVFYTSEFVTTEVLDHIHQSLNLLDISGFFCLICSPHAVCIDQFADPVSLLQLELESTDQLLTEFAVPKTFCPLPWMHLEIKHNGDLYPCCVYETSIGSAESITLEHALTGPVMSQLRTEFLQGQKPAGCSHCWQLEDQGLSSNRQWHVKQYSQKFYAEYFDNIQIRSLDIKPGNVCNFKCRICNPTNSSLFADEARQIGYQSRPVIAVRAGRWTEYNDYVWSELTTLLPTIENLDFYGGEPFLVKQIPDLLEYAVTSGHADRIRLHFNSNGSVFPSRMIHTLLKFKSVDITFSIDNIGKRFELERVGQWAEVADNILKFKQLQSQQFEVYLMPTVNIQNVYYLDQLLDWAENNDLRVTLNFLDRPNWANIDQLTDDGKQLVVDKYINSTNEHLKNIAHRVARSTGSNGKTFVKRMKQFDQFRNENFFETHPEIAQAMGY